MPDHSPAASEEAIMREVSAPLKELPDDPVASVANPDFPSTLRGYDRLAVDAYVKRVTQLVAELHATRSPQSAVRRALERVGKEVSEILQRAHETAEGIVARARAEAEQRVASAAEQAAELEREARARAEEIEREADRRARALDAEVDHIWAERDRIVSDVRRLAEELELLARAAATRFPPAAADELPGGSEAALAEETLAEEPLDEEAVGEEAVGEEAAVGDERPAAAQPTAAAVAVPELIDVLHLGRERVIGCWRVGDILIDPGPASCLDRLLEALGDEQPRALLLTHIHLDHAGAAGSLVARWPELEVYVHERGAPHLIDPARLLDSARRLYGGEMERLWGEVLAVPEDNVRALRGGERLCDERFEVCYTPGHASHHVAFLYDDGTAFVGDLAGVRIVPAALTVPPTPPPDIDIEAWHASIERVASWRPVRLAMTHFGVSEDAAAQLAEVSARLDRWAALARAEGRERFIDAVREEIERSVGPELLLAYTQAAPPEQIYAGLERYWRKRADGAAAEASTHAGGASLG